MSLKEMRQKKGYSRDDLATITKISRRNIEHYESGYRDINGAKLDTLCTLAMALDCRIENILTDEELKSKFRRATRSRKG